MLSVDLSEQMLRHAAGRSPVRVRADAAALALADAQVAVAAIDMLLFPAEVARVPAPDGVLLWINQLGEDGPLHLPASDVADALPGDRPAVESHAGWGSWAVPRRARRPDPDAPERRPRRSRERARPAEGRTDGRTACDGRWGRLPAGPGRGGGSSGPVAGKFGPARPRSD
ncbi:hypothetical protein [Streptomyces tropicalis]|uniref:Methyltransferase type 11 domain-containing protein n=1 Tax=Streptomyces tropicalis TaxID=3034234 RepID=A0ABT6A8Y7_9ACTN|nr:hypothetical protein [Streptomyces tropicalis]MDF3300877.1 hypothetical protein [Streptomyces tropicalis]